MNRVSREEAEAKGYAVFNNNDHICLDIEDQATITVNTPNGKITFAFMPYTEDGAPNCVDVSCHNDPEGKQKIIVFGHRDGKDRWHHKRDDEKRGPVGLVTVILKEEPL